MTGSSGEHKYPGKNLTDLGNARRFVERHGKHARFVPTWGWLYWDGKRWKRDDLRRIQRMAWDTVLAIYDEVKAAAAAGDTMERADLLKHAARSQHDSRVRALLSMAESHERVVLAQEKLDRDPWLVATNNGILDLKTGKLGPHRKQALISKLVPIDYDADAQCPRWHAFLDRVLGGNESLITFIQRAVGYTLTGDTSEECLFLLYGLGFNGKSKFLDVLQLLAGEHAVQADFATFLDQKQEGPRNDLARLAGARLVTSTEVGEGKRFHESLVKHLTGRDKMSARFLYREPFDFYPEFKLWLAVNHKPVIRDTSKGMWRRVRLIPFEIQIPEGERDPNIVEKLKRELPGILRWAVQGCLWWQSEGLGVPAVVQEATERYRAESDIVGAFIDECCELDPASSEGATSLYRAFLRWAQESGEYELSQSMLGRKLEERGLQVEKRGTGKDRLKFRIGVRLRNDRPTTLNPLTPLGTLWDRSMPIMESLS